MEDIKRDIKSFEDFYRSQREEATKLAQQLETFAAGSPEYKDLEAKMAKMTADMQVAMRLKKNEFLEREAKVYYNAYAEVLDHVGDFAARNNIGLVLRFNGTEIDPKDRASVLQGVNRAIVYQSRLNITQFIVERINKGTPPANVSNNPQIPRRR